MYSSLKKTFGTPRRKIVRLGQVSIEQKHIPQTVVRIVLTNRTFFFSTHTIVFSRKRVKHGKRTNDFRDFGRSLNNRSRCLHLRFIEHNAGESFMDRHRLVVLSRSTNSTFEWKIFQVQKRNRMYDLGSQPGTNFSRGGRGSIFVFS